MLGYLTLRNLQERPHFPVSEATTHSFNLTCPLCSLNSSPLSLSLAAPPTPWKAAHWRKICLLKTEKHHAITSQERGETLYFASPLNGNWKKRVDFWFYPPSCTCRSPSIPTCTFCCRHHVKILGCIHRERHGNQAILQGHCGLTQLLSSSSFQAEHFAALC